MSDRWIQRSIKHKGRVRSYVHRLYGSRAFTIRGTIRPQYLALAERRAKREGETSLERALNEAKTLAKMNRKRMAYA